MEPVKPVLKGLEQHEVVFAEHQPQYSPLPALRAPNKVVSRWRFSEEERVRIARGDDLLLTVTTYGHPLQPVNLQVVTDLALDEETLLEWRTYLGLATETAPGVH